MKQLAYFMVSAFFLFNIGMVFTASASLNPEAKSTPSNTGKDLDLCQEEVELTGALEVVSVPEDDYAEIMFLSIGTSASELSLEKASSISVALSDKSIAIYPVTWYTSEFDSQNSGLYLLQGDIVPPENVSISPQLSRRTIPVFVYDPEAPVVIPATSWVSSPYLIKSYPYHTGTALDTIQSGIRTDYKLNLGDNYWFPVSISWDLSSVDITREGSYAVHGIPDIEEGILLPEPFSPPVTFVNIQDPGVLSLSTPYLTRSGLFFYWLKELPELEKITLWYSVNEGDWIQDTEGELMEVDSSNSIVVHKRFLQADSTYFFRMEYEEEVSNHIEIVLTQQEITTVCSGGDRDGGDRDEQLPPEITQPAPETSAPETSASGMSHSKSRKIDFHLPTESIQASLKASTIQILSMMKIIAVPPTEAPQPSSATVLYSETDTEVFSNEQHEPTLPSPPVLLEEDTADTAVWSGTRVKKYKEAYPNLPLVFEKHWIRLEIPSESTLLRNMDNSDALRVDIGMLSDDTLSFHISLNDTPVTGLLPMTVTMPWTAGNQDSTFIIRSQSGEKVTDGIYIEESNNITFQVKDPGIYIIEEQQPEAPVTIDMDSGEIPRSSTGSSAGIFTVCGIVSIGIGVTYTKRRSSRKET